MEQLKRDNQVTTQTRLSSVTLTRVERDVNTRLCLQDLQARLSEEVKVIRSLVTGQGSGAGTDGGDRSWCEMQVRRLICLFRLSNTHRYISHSAIIVLSHDGLSLEKCSGLLCNF